MGRVFRKDFRILGLGERKGKCVMEQEGSHRQRDFLFAINLLSLVGVCLDVIQSTDVKVHYGFPGNQLPC